MLRNLIYSLIDRVAQIRLLRLHRPEMVAAFDHLRKGFRVVRWQLRTISNQLPDVFASLRWRLRASRLGRSADGIIVVPLLGAVLVLGVFTATAATRGSSGAGSDLASSTRQVVTGAIVTESEVVTETIKRDGKTIRIVHRKPGRVETIRGRTRTIPGGSVTIPGGAVTLPGQTHTVVETETRTHTVTDTVTVQQTNTVTQTQTVTETVTETVPPPTG